MTFGVGAVLVAYIIALGTGFWTIVREARACCAVLRIASRHTLDLRGRGLHVDERFKIGTRQTTENSKTSHLEVRSQLFHTSK